MASTALDDPEAPPEEESPPTQPKAPSQAPQEPDTEPTAGPQAEPTPEAAQGTPTPQSIVASPQRQAVNRSFAAQGFGAPSADYQGGPLAAPSEEPTAPQSQEDRYKAAHSAEDEAFKQEFFAQNPLKSTFDLPPTPTDRYRVAERRSDMQAAQDQRDQQRQQATAADTAKREAMLAQENQYRASGQKYLKDEKLGVVSPLKDENGQPVFERTGWRTGTNPTTGEPAWMMRDEHGQRQFKAPPIVSDPTGASDNAHYRMPDGTVVDSGKTLEQLAASTDYNTQRQALAGITKRNSARRQQALQAMEATTALARQPFIETSAAAEDAANRAADAGTRADAEQDPERKAQLLAQQQMAQTEADQLHAQVAPGGDLYHQNYAAQKQFALARVDHALKTYIDQQAEIEARAKAQGNDPAKDPTWQSNQQAIQTYQAAYDKGNADLKRIQTIQANRPKPLAPPPPAQPAAPAAQPAAAPTNAAPPPPSLPQDLHQSWASAGPMDRLKMIFGSKGYGQTEAQAAQPMVGSEAAGESD